MRSTTGITGRIFTTLAYADIFDYPLTQDETWEWLIWDGKKVRRRESEKEFVYSLQLALHSHSISIQEGFYYLKGREEIVKIRKEREGCSEAKLQIAEKTAGILRLIPWVKLIGITGSLTRNNASKEDDIDIFFITSKNRLWLTRGLVVLILSFFGLYRRKNKVADMICPNMFVSEDNLRMKPEDVYMAHEVCLMRPVFIRNNTYNKFLRVNSWALDFLPNVYRRITLNQSAEPRGKISENQLLDPLLSAFERMAKRAQIWYMRSRRTTEVVSDNLIKFHPHDVREEILTKWGARLESLR